MNERIAFAAKAMGLEALYASMDVHLDERDRLPRRTRRLFDTVTFKLHKADRLGLRRFQFSQNLLKRRAGDDAIPVVRCPNVLVEGFGHLGF